MCGGVTVGGTHPQDSILKFTPEGELVWDFGRRPPDGVNLEENNQQTDVLASKGRFQLDQDAREIYIINWKRVLVYDMDTGAAASGAGVQDDDFLTSYARNPERHNTPEDHLRARRLLANL